MKYHPDRNSGDNAAEQRFKEISEAYEVLKDGERRAAYDRFGHAAFENGPGGRGAGGFDFNFASGFADIFDEMFGEVTGGRRGRTASRGADLRYNMEVSLEEAFAGKTAQIRVPTSVLCKPCGGSGAEKGSAPVNCATCQGHGRVRAQQGFFTIERTCPNCHGAGRVIESQLLAPHLDRIHLDLPGEKVDRALDGSVGLGTPGAPVGRDRRRVGHHRLRRELEARNVVDPGGDLEGRAGEHRRELHVGAAVLEYRQAVGE